MDYLDINKANWDDRAPIHAASAGYGLERYVQDPSYISDVVRFDVPRLGSLEGLRVLHLQCHIGTDTLSLARLGASVSGLDFSSASLEQARSLAAATNTDITYVEADVYSACKVLPEGAFDVLYTGIGAINWLPSIERWADVVARLLAPGGMVFLRDCHPMLFTIDETRLDVLEVKYPYFETDVATIWDDDSTYIDTDDVLTATTTHEWNHGLGEIVTALLTRGFTLEMLIEHDSLPWEALPGRMVQDQDDEWRLRDHRELLPLSFTLRARKEREAPEE